MDEFYDSPKWREKKEHILRRDMYQCQVCRRYGRLIPADLVHHIFPLEEFPEYAFSDWNLISVSLKQHNKIHDRNTNELTELGRDILLRTARKNNIPIPDKYMHPIKKVHHNGNGKRF